MSRLIAIDPGAVCGVAVFEDSKLEYGFKLPITEIDDVENWFHDHHLSTLPKPTILVEKPSYVARDVNDVIKLAIRVGRIAQLLHVPDSNLVWPQTWKGSVPKRYHQVRILKKLTDEEKQRIEMGPRARTFDHNIVDAIGLGLWRLGRLQR